MGRIPLVLGFLPFHAELKSTFSIGPVDLPIVSVALACRQRSISALTLTGRYPAAVGILLLLDVPCSGCYQYSRSDEVRNVLQPETFE